MIRLTKDAFAKAREYLLTNARPLERALFLHEFEDGPKAAVSEAIESFRNADGGFGNALEPDVRTPASSALATAIALRAISELDCPVAEALAPAAIDYLLATLDPATLTWRVVPPSTNDHPHAPWWHDEDGSLARTFDDFTIIPRAMIVGLLHRYAALVPPELLRRLDEATVKTVAELPVLGTGGGSDLEYVSFLARAPGLSPRDRALLIERVRCAVPAVVVRDPEQWSGYCITPLCAAPTPAAPGADEIRDALDAHLDWTIRHQAKDGAWDPSWSWFGNYPEVWPTAEREWRGVLTLKTLITLREFGRLRLVSKPPVEGE